MKKLILSTASFIAITSFLIGCNNATDAVKADNDSIQNEGPMTLEKAEQLRIATEKARLDSIAKAKSDAAAASAEKSRKKYDALVDKYVDAVNKLNKAKNSAPEKLEAQIAACRKQRATIANNKSKLSPEKLKSFQDANKTLEKIAK